MFQSTTMYGSATVLSKGEHATDSESSHIRVVGSYVCDTTHVQWMEIHPVTSITAIPGPPADIGRTRDKQNLTPFQDRGGIRWIANRHGGPFWWQ